MANAAGLAYSFKTELMNGSHAFGAQGANDVRTVTTKDTFYAALYLTSGSKALSDTAYNTTNELAASGNYTQGGVALTNATAPALSSNNACWTPSAQAQWTSLTSSGAFDTVGIYNYTSTGKLLVGYWSIGSQSITAGTLNLTMPANTSGNALVQVS
jgi:hypothetical protein